MRNSKDFKDRFLRWKNGELVYEAGRALPKYLDGKDYDKSGNVSRYVKKGMSDQQYINIMEKVARNNYKHWGFENEDLALLYALNDNTYNYRGYYNKYPNGDGNAVDHWTDEFKTVWHPTFSNESIYSGKKSQYNPKGLNGGRWSGEKFIPANWQKPTKYKDGKLPHYAIGDDPDVVTKDGAYSSYIPGTLMVLPSDTSNSLFRDDVHFKNSPLRVFDNFEVTPKGARFKNWQQYQKPWNSNEFISTILMPLNIVLPTNLLRGLYNDVTGNGYDGFFNNIFLPNNGFFPDSWAERHPYIAMGGNMVADAAILGGPSLLGDAARGTNLYKTFAKNISRNAYRGFSEDASFFARQGAMKRPVFKYIKPNQSERNAFLKNYNRFASMTEKNISGDNIRNIIGTNNADFDRTLKLLRDNPEYFDFLLEKFAATGQQINPFGQLVLDEFFRRQGSSIRGVHAENMQNAMKYLSETERGRYMPGGDRLGSNGGLYVSNSNTVSDTFKNSYDALENGYVGRLFGDLNVNTQLTPEQQLLLYRKKIIPVSNSSPLGGTGYEATFVDDATNNGAIAFEADYVGRANKGLPGYERVYLPEKYGIARPVTVQNITTYGKSPDKHGRWMQNTTAERNPDLFISRQLNRSSDFVQFARSFLKGRKVRDFNAENQLTKKLLETLLPQMARRDELLHNVLDFLEFYRKLITSASRFGTAAGVSSPFGYFTLRGLNRPDFFNSQDFMDFVDNVDKHAPDRERYSRLRESYMKAFRDRNLNSHETRSKR